MAKHDIFTIGIEEEYLLVNKETKSLSDSVEAQEAIINDITSSIDENIGFATPEFLKSQVEIGTSVSSSIKELSLKLKKMRMAVACAADKHGLAPIAASTHPLANWKDLQHTDKERYNNLAADLQRVVKRLAICGMHVHVGVPNQEHRIDLLNQIAYFLPHMLALSTSSPFWSGENSGLMSYRLAVFDELPRTGLPERFESWAEYQRHLKILEEAEIMPDSTKLWWDIRPHTTLPTLEMRIADICTTVDDGITIAAIYACLLSMLQRLRRDNQRWRVYNNMLVYENRWLAQRHGIDKGMIDFGKAKIIPYDELLEEIIELTREDQERLDCVEEVANARNIIKRGTSAHRQIAIFSDAIANGKNQHDALNSVVDWLISETMRGIRD